MAGESIKSGVHILGRSIRYGYDYLGTVLISSALWFLIGLTPSIFTVYGVVRGPDAVRALLALVTLLFLTAPATAAVFSMTGRIVGGEETVLKDFFTGYRHFFWKSAALTALHLIILVVLVVDLVFVARHPSPLVRLLLGLWVYVLAFWGLMGLFLFPLLVKQDAGVLKTMRRAALIALDNTVQSAVIAAFVVVFSVVSALFTAAMLLIYMGLVSFSLNVALLEVFKKYERQRSQGSGEEATEEAAPENPV